nr:PREDICTED: zinc finger BED domain-containing protein 1-like [Linepithema humile]
MRLQRNNLGFKVCVQLFHTSKQCVLFPKRISNLRLRSERLATVSNESNDDLSSDTSSSVSNKRQKLEFKVKLRQPNRDVQIDMAFERTNSFGDGGLMANRITNAVLYMIATDNAPLSIIKNDGFKLLMKTAVPLYKLPSRKTITRLMAVKYEMLKEDVKLHLKELTSYTITCDNWTDVSNLSYIGVTIHYATTDGILKNRCLAVEPLHENHTAQYLSEILLSVLNSFGLNPEIATAIVTDSAANIKKAVYELLGRSKHLPCFAHLLSHLVPDVMAGRWDSSINVDDIITKVRNIVVLVKRSIVATDELKRLQIRDGKTEATALKFIQDVSTQWNSTLYMLERFLVLKEYVYLVTLKCRNIPEMLTRDEIQLLKNLVCLLTPIERVIREISGDTYPTTSLIIPIIHCMEEAIHSWEPKEDDNDNVKKTSMEFKDKLLKAKEHRFKEQELNSILAVSTILDLRFKKLHFQSALTASSAITKINSLLKFDAASEMSNTIPKKPFNSESNIWEYRDKMVTKNMDASNDKEGLNLELRHYLN